MSQYCLPHPSIMLASVDASGGWRRMHGQSPPVQGQTGPVMARRPRRRDLTHTLVRFSERVETERKRISLVTTPGRCFSIIARRSNCHCGELVSPNLLEGTRTSFPQANAQPNPWVIRITSRADVPILSRIEPSREPSRLCGCEGRRGLFPRGFRESGSLRGAGRR
jgi:hypothetical protein